MKLVTTFPDTWRAGAHDSAVLGTPIILVADVVNGVAESRYSSLRNPAVAAGYQVTAGRTLWLTKLVVSASVLNVLWLTGAANADAGDSQIAAPAGAASRDSRADGVANPRVTQAALVVSEYDVMVSLPGGTFGFVRNLTPSSTVRVWYLGIEV